MNFCRMISKDNQVSELSLPTQLFCIISDEWGEPTPRKSYKIDSIRFPTWV